MTINDGWIDISTFDVVAFFVRHDYDFYVFICFYILSCTILIITRGQSNLTKSASRGAHSPVRSHPRGSNVVPLNSWGRVSY